MSVNIKVIIRYQFKYSFKDKDFNAMYEFVRKYLGEPTTIKRFDNIIRFFKYSRTANTFDIRLKKLKGCWYLDYIVTDGELPKTMVELSMEYINSITDKVRNLFNGNDMVLEPEVVMYSWSDSTDEPLNW